MRANFPSRDWLRAFTPRGRIVSVICIIMTLPLACTPQAPTPGDGSTQVTSHDTASLPVGEIIYSGSPEDARLAYIELPEGTWEYFGRRDADGTPIAIDVAQFTRGDLVTQFSFEAPGSVRTITTTNTSTGESTAMRITSLGGDQYQIDGFEPASSDTPTVSRVVTIPASVFGGPAKLRHEAGQSAESDYASLEKSLLAIKPGLTLATAKAIATPTTEARATFRILIKTQAGNPVTDATVNFSLKSRSHDKLPMIAATHIGGGTYEGAATLARTGALGQYIKECEAQIELGTIATTGVVGIIAVATFLLGGSELLLAGVIGKLALAGGVVSAALTVKNKYELRGPCAMINDFLAAELGQNLMVNAEITQCPSLPNVVGTKSPVTEVPITPVATAGTGAGTIWGLAPLIVNQPLTLTTFDGNYDVDYQFISGTQCATISNGRVTNYYACDGSYQVSNAQVFTVSPRTDGGQVVSFNFGISYQGGQTFAVRWDIYSPFGIFTEDKTLRGTEFGEIGGATVSFVATRKPLPAP